ncbi:MAG: hypothetical protein K6E12_01695 [Saccharofermentans sp.]|nr:hypothetical protein [Saccharofermentans sp.]
MFPDLAIRFKNYAADMGSGFVVIAGFLLAITMVFVIVFARWNSVNSNPYAYVNNDKPRVETTAVDTGYVDLSLTDID